MAIKTSNSLGLLILRLGIGLVFIKHGYPKIAAGPETWQNLGQTLQMFGIDFLPTVFGFLASLSELLGGALLIIGLFTRTAALFMLITMAVATLKHYTGEGGWEHPLTNAIVFATIIVTGGGPFAIDNLLFNSK